MPYVNSDGSVSSTPPLLVRIKTGFWGFVNFLTIFFRTLINPGANGRGSNYVSEYRTPGSGGGPPPPPRRKYGGFKTLSDCRTAPMPGGG